MSTRRSHAEQLATLQEQRAKLDARMKALQARQKEETRKTDTRRKIVVGGAVLAHAALHPEFAAVLRGVLKVAVTRDIDKAVVADLLG